MRRAQATLEYAYLIGIAAVAIIAMLVYISRGSQGSLRTLTEQIGAGAYAPGNTIGNNTETKHMQSKLVSKSSVTTKYGNSQSENAAMNENREKQQRPLREELWNLKEELKEAKKTATGSALVDSMNKQISDKTRELNRLTSAYKNLSEVWENRTIIPDATNTAGSNTETGNQAVSKQTNEALGGLADDRW